MQLTLYFCLLTVLLPTLLLSQSGDTVPTLPPHRIYLSQDYEANLAEADATVRTIGRSIAQQEDQQLNELLTSVDDWEELVVPIVFHVLYTSSDDRVTEQQIDEQLEILNEDFSAASVPTEDDRDPNMSFRGLAADTRIRFCRVMPSSGTATAEVDYQQIGLVTLSQATEASPFNHGTLATTSWEPGRHLNVYIIPQADNVAGYAQLPGAKGLTDGIVIDPRFFGVGSSVIPPYDGGKTLTHLVGTYLGLSELWAKEGCGDDGVEDTPVHNAPNFGIPGPGHISTCDGQPFEMTMNFMDNTDDAAQYMFTYGQAARMRSVLLPGGLRAELPATTACTTEAPIVGAPLMGAPAVTTSTPAEEVDYLDLAVSPNPTREQTVATIALPQDVDYVGLAVFNAGGSKVYAKELLRSLAAVNIIQDAFNVTDWPAGIYIVRITAGERQLTHRLIVQ